MKKVLCFFMWHYFCIYRLMERFIRFTYDYYLETFCRMENNKGFSLIELLIVVVIIGIIAAIAIPNLLASRRASNEGSAIASLRAINTAQMTYKATRGNGNYAGDSSDVTVVLSELGDDGSIDVILASGIKSGYQFEGLSYVATAGLPAQFYIASEPVTPSGITATGTKDFTISTDGVIYTGPNGSISYSLVTGDLIRSGGTPIGNK